MPIALNLSILAIASSTLLTNVLSVSSILRRCGFGAGFLDDSTDVFDKILLTHLQRADIDRHSQVFSELDQLTSGPVGAGKFQHRGAQRED